jgi:nucleoid-associated protein YgaU
MRAWAKSACLVLAWSILAVVMVAVGMHPPSAAAQANTRSSSSSSGEVSPGRFVAVPGGSGVSSSAGQVVVASSSVTAAPAAARPEVRYVVRAGDTLSGIAAVFGVHGGWPVLYAANRQVIGPDPDVIEAGMVVVVPGRLAAVRYTVAPGDSLSGIAAAFGVHGGWPVLYAANRQVVGSDPGVIQAGVVLRIPHPLVVSPPAAGKPHRPASRPVPYPSVRPSPAQHPVPANSGPSPVTGGMPGWLRTTLLAVGLLIAAAFVTEPVLAARRRRQTPAQASATAGRPGSNGHGPQPGTAAPDAARPGPVGPGTPESGRAHIVLADHDRLVVTRSQTDDMVYVLRPPGADPKAILRVASLVLPECRYGELAEQLGVPATWPME